MYDIDMEEYVGDKINHYMKNIYTALPAIITKVDLANQKIDAKPAVNYLYKDFSSTEFPIFTNIPLIFPASKSSSLTFPVSIGDTVLLVFSKKGITKFKLSDGNKPVTPNDFREFDKRDAVAIPGLFPFKTAVNKGSNRSLPHNANDLVLAHNLGKAGEAEIRIKPDGEIILNTPVKVTVNAPESEFNSNMTINGTTTLNGVTQVNSTLGATGTITSDTDVVAGAISLSSHTHSHGDPAGVTSPPI